MLQRESAPSHQSQNIGTIMKFLYPLDLDVNIHLLSHCTLAASQLVYRNVLANLLLRNDLLIQHSCGTSLKNIALLLLTTLIRLNVASLQRRLLLRNNRNIHVRSRSQIVEYTSLNSIARQRDSLLLRHTGLPLRLEDRHSGKRTRAHGDIRQLIRASVCVHSEEPNTGRINACYDEVCADVSLVAEEVLLEHGHTGHDSRLAAGGEGVELEFGGDEGGCEFGVCGGTGSGTPDLRGDIMELLAVLGGS